MPSFPYLSLSARLPFSALSSLNQLVILVFPLDQAHISLYMYVCMYYVCNVRLCMYAVDAHYKKNPDPIPGVHDHLHFLILKIDRNGTRACIYRGLQATLSLSPSQSLSPLPPLYQVCIEKTGETWRVKQIMAKVIFMLQVLCASSLLSACFFDNKHDVNKDDAHRSCSLLFRFFHKRMPVFSILVLAW